MSSGAFLEFSCGFSGVSCRVTGFWAIVLHSSYWSLKVLLINEFHAFIGCWTAVVGKDGKWSS